VARLHHSQHWRLLQVLPVQGIPMILRLQLGRWYCLNNLVNFAGFHGLELSLPVFGVNDVILSFVDAGVFEGERDDPAQEVLFFSNRSLIDEMQLGHAIGRTEVFVADLLPLPIERPLPVWSRSALPRTMFLHFNRRPNEGSKWSTIYLQFALQLNRRTPRESSPFLVYDFTAIDTQTYCFLCMHSFSGQPTE
jgi:hypothetical protein